MVEKLPEVLPPDTGEGSPTSGGQEIPAEKASHNVTLSDEAPHIDFRELGTFGGEKVDFPDLEHFGFQHGSDTQRMAWVLMSFEDVEDLGDGRVRGLPEDQCVVNTNYNRRVMWLAAYLHDIGRTKPWDEEDKNAEARSAEIAMSVFDAYPELKEEKGGEYMLDVLNLIRQRTTGTTPLHEILREADRFEEARFAPNTKKAFERLTKVWPKMTTTFGRNKSRQLHYMKFKGWVTE